MNFKDLVTYTNQANRKHRLTGCDKLEDKHNCYRLLADVVTGGNPRFSTYNLDTYKFGGFFIKIIERFIEINPLLHDFNYYTFTQLLATKDWMNVDPKEVMVIRFKKMMIDIVLKIEEEKSK